MSETRTKNWGAQAVDKPVLETSWIEEVSGTLSARAQRLQRLWVVVAGIAVVFGIIAAALYWFGQGHEPLKALQDPDIPKVLAKALEGIEAPESVKSSDDVQLGFSSLIPSVWSVMKFVGVIGGLLMLIAAVATNRISLISTGLMLSIGPFLMSTMLGGMFDDSAGDIGHTNPFTAISKKAEIIDRQHQIEEAINFGLPARVTELVSKAPSEAQHYLPYLVAQAQLKQKDSEISWDAYRANVDKALVLAMAAKPELEYSPRVIAMMENKAWGESRSQRSFSFEQKEAEAKGSLNHWAFLLLTVCGLAVILSGLVLALEQYMRRNIMTIYRLSGVEQKT